ncbi:hypothetical protein C8R44DRAFT_705872, partial [Mycena epipterygia]
MSTEPPDYYTVTQDKHGKLICNCPQYRQTDKTCEHTFAVKLEIDFGNVERYNDLETIRKIRGKAAQGQKNNPQKKQTGRQPQRRSDRTVEADLERFLEQVKSKINPWKPNSSPSGSDNNTSEDTDGNSDGVDIDDPLKRTASQLSAGRAPGTKALHPARTSGKAKNDKARDSDSASEDASKPKRVVKFSQPPGPKRGHPDSLLPGSSPAKKEADEKEKKRLAEE